ncbi:MAG: hypothetical protein CMO01_15235 [Thalassobius sp.]|nr:hypothetical protein [Thalassovita sp.]
MEEFIFNGNWETKLTLELFDAYYAKEYTSEGINLVKRIGNKITLVIADEYGDLDPDPKPEQLSTISFLLNPKNQTVIIHSIIKYLNEVIYPYYKKNIFLEDEYPESYPTVYSFADFQKYFRLYSVSVYSLSKDNQAYYCLYFNVDLLDQEHGLSIELIRDQCIDHGTSDGTNGYNLAQELGLPSNETARNLMHARISNELPIFYKPNPKYGTLKPWQIDANLRYPSNVYKAGKDLELIEFINNSNKPIINFKYLYNDAVRDNREELIHFFKEFKELK